MAGVGTTPALVTAAPSLDAPCANAASIHPPDSRVSRPTSNLPTPRHWATPEPALHQVFGRSLDRAGSGLRRHARRRSRRDARSEPQSLPLVILTWTTVGSIAVVPASPSAPARTGSVYGPAPRPARST